LAAPGCDQLIHRVKKPSSHPAYAVLAEKTSKSMAEETKPKPKQNGGNCLGTSGNLVSDTM